MTVARTLENYLREHAVPYKVVEHPRAVSSKATAGAAHLEPDDVAKAVLLGDERGYVMAVLPGGRHVELHKLCDKLRRKLGLVSEERLARVFQDCELGAIPPIGPAYNIETVVDESLVGRKRVWFVGGDHDRLLAVEGEDFVRLLGRARFGRFSH